MHKTVERLNMKGKTQSYARYLNNKLVIGELYNNNCSATMLAQKLDLSNAAMSVIIDDLKRNGYIKEAEGAITSSVGRRPVYYSINEHFGRLGVVSLGDYTATVALSDMRGNIVEYKRAKVEHYNVETLYELVLMLNQLVQSPKSRDIPLLGIELSVPGLVNTVTGELQLSPQFDKDLFGEKNYMVNLFTRQFGVPVSMTNDINLAIISEVHSGLLRGVKNGMLVHVDEGVGGAFILNHALYTGTQGFAGEIGLVRTQCEGKEEALDEFVSVRAIRSYLNELYKKSYTLDEIVDLYHTNTEVRAYILKTAECLGKTLKNVVDLLDISKIVLSGAVTRFGESYIAVLNGCVEKAINKACVVPSNLDADAALTGAVAKGIERLTDEIFKSDVVKM